MLKKLLWTLLASASAVLAARLAAFVWRAATGEDPPSKPLWAKLLASPVKKKFAPS